MRHDRERTAALLASWGVDALVGTSFENVHYLTGISKWPLTQRKPHMMSPGRSGRPPQVLAVVTADGATVLLAEAGAAGNAAAAWADECRLCGAGLGPDAPLAELAAEGQLGRLRDALRSSSADDTPVTLLARCAAEMGWGSGTRVGVELVGLPESEGISLRTAAAAAGAATGDCTECLRLLRMVKTGPEVELMRRAARVAERAASAALDGATAGTRLADVRGSFAAAVATEGAAIEHFAFCPYGMVLTEAGDYRLQPGDAMFLDYGCVLDGYYSDSGITLSVGPLGGARLDTYHLLGAAEDAARQLLHPGTAAFQVQAAMAQIMREASLDAFPHGHGLGLEMRDYPILVPDTGLRIRDDFVDLPADLTIEEGIW